MRQWAWLTGLLLVGAWPRPALAAEATTPPPGLTGDWGGWRQRLFDAGVALQVGYVTELAYNARGGTGHALRQAGQLTAGLGVNLDALVGVPGGSLQFTVTYRTGNDLGADMALGTLQLVQEVYGRGEVGRITQLWYEQSFLDKRLKWKLGRLTVGEDTADFPCDFQNLTFCGAQPGNIVGSYWFNWPVSQWGTRLRGQPSQEISLQLAAYEINPENLNENFSIGHFSGATGVMIPAELAWDPRFREGALTGHYVVGAWYDTSNADDVLFDVDRQPQPLTGEPFLRRSGRYGAYLIARQQLTQSPSGTNPVRGLNVFLRLAQADRNTAAVDNQLTAGLLYTAPFASRPDDDVGLAIGRTHANRRAITFQELEQAHAPATAISRTEYEAELYYTLHATPWLLLRPNVQYIHHPGATQVAADVVILGLKASLGL
ncbi:hypothetical protein DRW03_27340 [Corallococcus sp. H22C18031201]|nr:hypothetical protein DRW03_27340 [Corallococcus sp. H22C18031201]